MNTTAHRAIPVIDKQIDANKRKLLARRPITKACQGSAAAWQAAWDAEPDLHTESQALWRERGLVQQARDERDLALARRENKQTAKPKKCPTCGHRAA